MGRIYQVIFCLVGLANFALVLFDATYLWKLPYTRLTARDLYLAHAPDLVRRYDPVKGIDAHRFTTAYLAQADHAFELSQAGNYKDAEKVYADLAAMSREVIDQRPGFSHFSIAEKDGTLQVIKNAMRGHFGIESAKDSFARYWSRENLALDRIAAEKGFFDREIRPLMAQNYFRWIDEDGEMRDYFYRIDLWFVAFFLVDFLARWVIAIRLGRHRKWYMFPVRHGVEIFNLVPPHHAVWMRLLRAIPLYLRMKKAGMIPGEGIMPEILHDNAALIAEEISGLVLVNILDQLAVMVRDANPSGIVQSEVAQVTKDLLDSQLDRIADTVVPDVEPQITGLVIHSVYQAMGPYLRTPLGPAIRLGMYAVEAAIKDGLRSALVSQDGREQMKGILRKFLSEGTTELTASENLAVIQNQSSILLDRIKHEVLRSLDEG
ncbi:MAG TPA: hypothetical protein PKK45_08340 [Leptospiraceae bacterium]|nr:hypothetical protein [Leptospiraceae bacterium]